MKLDITATVRPDPLQRAGHWQVRLRAVACDDKGKPYLHNGTEIAAEREIIRDTNDAKKLAADLARDWEAKARGQLMTALRALGLVKEDAAVKPETFKVTL